MPIVTIADLYAAGADFEVESFLSGEVRRFSTITEQLQYNLGGDFQATPETVGQFVALVQQAMESATEVRALFPIESIHPPSRPDIVPAGDCEHRGSVKITPLDDNGEPISDGIWLPFSINSPTIMSEQEIADYIGNTTNIGDFVKLVSSPQLTKRLETLGYNQQRYGSQSIEVKLRAVYGCD